MQQTLLEQRRLLLECVERLRSFKGHLVAFGGGADPAGLVLNEFIRIAGGHQARIATVPVASYMREMGAIYRDILHEIGIGEMWVVDPEGPQCNDPIVRPSLMAASGICITGGDQKRLADELVGTLTLQVVLEALQAGIPVYCTSASTVGLSDRMIGGLDDDDRVRVMQGLGILPGVTIETHVTQRNRYGRLVELAERKINPLIVGMDENTGLIFRPHTSVADVRGTGNIFITCCHDAERSRCLGHGDVVDLADFIPYVPPEELEEEIRRQGGGRHSGASFRWHTPLCSGR